MVLQRLRELIGPHSQMRYATGRDSVDEMVTFEYYPMTNSTWQNEEVGRGGNVFWWWWWWWWCLGGILKMHILLYMFWIVWFVLRDWGVCQCLMLFTRKLIRWCSRHRSDMCWRMCWKMWFCHMSARPTPAKRVSLGRSSSEGGIHIYEYITFYNVMMGNCSVYIEIHRSKNVGSWLVVVMVLYVLHDFFDSLLNRGRYLPEERRTHNLHFDSHAFATVVLGLTSPEAWLHAEDIMINEYIIINI